MTVPKAAQLSMFMSVPPLSRKKIIVSYLPSFLSFTFLPFNTKFLESLFHVAAKCVSWGSSNKNIVILDFSRNLGNLFVKSTGQVVKLDES